MGKGNIVRKGLAAVSFFLLVISVFLPFYKTFGELYPKGWVSLYELTVSFLSFASNVGLKALEYTAQLMYTIVLLILVIGGLTVLFKGRTGALLSLIIMIILTVWSYTYLYESDSLLWREIWLQSITTGYYTACLGSFIGLFSKPLITRPLKKKIRETITPSMEHEYCMNCGAKLKPESRFCIKCGVRVKKE